jgi:hypothetical protein
VSLGLPEFGSRGQADQARGLWRGLQIAGYVALAYAIVIAATERIDAYSADRSLEKARTEVATLAQSAETGKRMLVKSADLLVAASSVESSPARVIADLREILPEGVSITTYKIDYLPDASARVDLGVIARGPEAYDRFLSALSKSEHFRDIRPGSESRPGLVRATVTAIHRPGTAGR